jgi:hypothetical protein
MKMRSSCWLQLPVVAAAIVTTAMPLTALPWPDRVPKHFDAFWRANAWGSATGIAWAMPAAAVAQVLAGVVVAEVWARAEARGGGQKRFNWVLVLVAANFGFLAGMSVWYWTNLHALAAGAWLPGWRWIGVGAGLAAGAMALLEALRKPAAAEELFAAESEKERSTREQVAARMGAGQRWTYCASQKWGTWMWIIYGGAALPAVVGISKMASDRVGGLVLILAGGIVLGAGMLMNQLHVLVNGQCLILRAGILRVRLLKVKLAEVASARTETFSPVLNYGGWGIRYAAGTWAYIIRGNSGVRIETKEGKRYLIGSDEPEQLVGVIRAGAGLSGFN